MSLNFSIPRNIPLDVEQELTRLISDFQDGYLTEKGYIKKRYEILESLKADATDRSTLNGARSDTRSNHRRESIMSVGSSLAYNRSSERLASGEFYDPSLRTTPEIQRVSPSDSRVTGVDPDAYEYYKFQQNAPQPENVARKQLQRPLDPRILEQYVQTETFDNLAMILRKRSTVYSKENAVVTIDQRGKESQSITWEKLYLRAEKVAKQIKNKAALYPGDRVCLIYQNIEVIDFVVAFYGCFLSGTVAVPMSSGLPVRDFVKIMTDTQSHLCLMSESVFKHFEKASHKRKVPLWPKGVEVWKTSDMGTYQPPRKVGPPPLKISDLAYIEYSRGSMSELRGVAISHRTIIHQMKSLTSIISSTPDIKKGTLIRPSAALSKFRYTILSTLDVRQSIGLVMGALFSVYSGNPLIWIHQKLTEVPGLYAHVISRARASILLSDYLSLKQVAYNYQSFPQLTRTFNKRVKVDLSCVKWCLINTLIVDCEFNDKLSDRWFKPLGHPHPRRIIAPMLCLNEQGGAIICMRDWIGNEDRLGCSFQKPITDEVIPNDENEDGNMGERLSEVLIDKDSLTTNTVKVVSDRPPPTSSTYDDESSKYIRVGAFGYPIPDATLAIVNPEAKILSGYDEVGEIWVDSHCISGGYWGLPDATQNIFQAECSDYEGVLNINFVRTGLLGFIYNGKVYVLGLYEDRINQHVTWYDRYLAIQTKKEEEKVSSSDLGDVQSLDENTENINQKILMNSDIPQYRYHYAGHLVKTLVRNIPDVTDCSFFNVRVNNEYLPIAIIESPSIPASKNRQKNTGLGIITADPSLLNDLAIQTMKLMEKLHNVRLFCVLITAPNTLPRTIRSGRLEIANMLCKRKFMEGRISSSFVRFSLENSLATVYHGDDLLGGIWSPYSSKMRSEALENAQLQYSGLDVRQQCRDDRANIDLTGYSSMIDILKVRASQQPDEQAYAVIGGANFREMKPLSWKKFENRVFALCSYILEKKNLMAGDTVMVVYNISEEYVICIYACWLAGFTVIPIPALDPSWVEEDTVSFVQLVQEYKVKAVFMSSDIEQIMKNKPISSRVKQIANANRVTIPKYRNTTKHTKCNTSSKAMYSQMEAYRNKKRKGTDLKCLIWITWDADHRYNGAQLSFANLMALALNAKETCQMKSRKPLIACVRHTFGLGFLQACIMGIYLGCPTYLFSTLNYGINPTALWLSISRYGVENMFVTSKMLTYALRNVDPAKCDLHKLKNLMVGWEGRPDAGLMLKFQEKFQVSHIPPTSLSNVYQNTLNPMITTRSYLAFETSNLWLDPLALAQGYVSLVNPNDSPEAIEIQDSGIVPVNTQIVIVNPETKQPCKVGELGEIWVYSQSTLSRFSGKRDTESSFIHDKIANWNDSMTYLRTGDFGFLHNIQKPVSKSSQLAELQLLFNLGRIDQTFEVLGLQYFASDIETTLERFSAVKKACVFKAGTYVVAVLETTLKKNYSSLTPLLVIKVMNQFNLMLDIVSYVPVGKMPTSRLGQVQRRITLKKWMDGCLSLQASFGVNSGENATRKTLDFIKKVKNMEQMI